MMAINANASPASTSWDTLNWVTVEAQVKQLQMRIAKAIREGKYRKAKSLQWLLTHSYFAKLLAMNLTPLIGHRIVEDFLAIKIFYNCIGFTPIFPFLSIFLILVIGKFIFNISNSLGVKYPSFE
jgi:hypothetical protein